MKFFIQIILSLCILITSANATVCYSFSPLINHWNPYATDIEKTSFLPLEIATSYPWDEIKLTFDIQPISEQGISPETLKIPTTITQKSDQTTYAETCMEDYCSGKCPVVIKIPIKMMGDGLFQIKVKIQVMLENGTILEINNFEKDLSFSVFAYNGKFGTGENPLAAMEVVAREQMIQENHELRELLIKESQQRMAYYNRDLKEYRRIKKLNDIPTPTQHHINGSLYKRAQQLQQEYYLKYPLLESVK